MVLGACLALVAAPAAQARSDRGERGPVAPLATCAYPSADASAAARAPVPPAGYAQCPKIRPGDYLFSKFGDASASCVIGFLYRDRRGDTYFSTGADCVPPYNFNAIVTTWAPGKGPAALDGRSGQRIGEWAFRYDKAGVTMSLVRLDRGVAFDPQVCHYGGPTGLNTDVSTAPEQVVMVGPQGGTTSYEFGPVSTAGSVLRPGFADAGLYHRDRVLVTGQMMIESGMPVLTTDGRAVGTAEWYGVEERPVTVMQIGLVVNRPTLPMFMAGKALRTSFTMLTAPLL